MRRRWIIATAALLPPALALAQAVPDDRQPAVTLPDATVVGASPLVSSGLARDKVSAGVSSVGGKEIARTGVPDALGTLSQTVAGATLNEAGGNRFQPDLIYRGFTASPSDGADQGLAVYVNGARFNQPFGDSTLWDLLPGLAIDKIDAQGANPIFGLNALGGSLNVKLKNGFTYHGAEVSAYGGAFGRAAVSFQSGMQSGGTAAYVATNAVHEDGWRQGSQSDLRQFYGDIGWRGTDGEAHLGIVAARNDLNNPGTSPIGLLASNRALMFTGPNQIHDKYLMVNANGNYDVNDDISLQALTYYTNLSQRIVNGNLANFQVCDSGGFLCEQDGTTPLTTRGGVPIPDYLNGATYSELNNSGVDSNGYGASVQATDDADRFGMTNKLILGGSFDGGVSTFDAQAYTGGLSAQRNFIGPVFQIDQSDGSIAPVRVIGTNAYYGAYASDVLDLTKQLSLTLSGRFNVAKIQLADQFGGALSGVHNYQRFNPGLGLAYRLTPAISVYASYAEANRAPTPAELSCASINAPCTLANFFVGDPNLKQVVARTFEIGVRGLVEPFAASTVKWDVAVYRTDTQDDLIFSPSTIAGRDFFQNIGRTQRQGIDASLMFKHGPVTLTAGYSLTDATFQVPLTLDSGLNPRADASGQIHVRPGDRLPGIPMHQFKLGADWQITPRLLVGARALAETGEVLFGDEANLTASTGNYIVVNGNVSYKVTSKIELFALLQNVFNAKYATYGTFSDPTAIPCPQCGTSTRALSPAPPIAAYGGVRVTF